MTDTPHPDRAKEMARESLYDRALQFSLLQLPGQPQGMHMGTSYLVNDLVRALKAADEKIAALSHKSSEAPGWRAIESAPKDGCYLLANDRGQVCPVKSNNGFRIVSNMPGYADWDAGTSAIAWMPLPPPPVSEGAK